MNSVVASDRPSACPLCGGRPKRIEMQFGPTAVWSCRDCTNAWTYPPPVLEEDYYQAADFHAGAAPDPLPEQWGRALDKQAALLSRHLPAGSGVLEVGCGQGLLLRRLRDKGFRVLGLEPSRSAATIAAAAGLTIFNEELDEFDASEARLGGPISAVVFSHVLEHLPDPAAALRTAARVPGCQFILLVQANWRGLMPRMQGGNWHAWVPDQHYWHFSPAGLTKFVKNLGWSVAELERSSLEHHSVPLSRMLERTGLMLDQFHLLARTTPPETP